MLEGKAEWLEPLFNWQEMIGGRLHTHTHTLLKVRTHVPKRKVEAHIRTVADVEDICTHTHTR